MKTESARIAPRNVDPGRRRFLETGVAAGSSTTYASLSADDRVILQRVVWPAARAGSTAA